MTERQWVIAEAVLLEMLRRAAAGETPEMILMEEYANSEIEGVDGK